MKLYRENNKRMLTVHSGFLPQFLFRVETSHVHCMSHEIDISQGPIEDLASKAIFLIAIYDQF